MEFHSLMYEMKMAIPYKIKSNLGIFFCQSCGANNRRERRRRKTVYQVGARRL